MIPLANPTFDGRELEYVTDCLKSGWISRGQYIDRFEARLSEMFGAPAVTCSSGTAALHLALLAAGIGPGDEVIVPDVTFASTAAVVKAVGATPVLVDIGEDMQIDEARVERAITPRTAAIMPVALYGERRRLLALRYMVQRLSIRIIEDAAEIIERFDAKSADYTCFSLFANKWITTGEGGFVLTRDPDMIRHWRDHGMDRPYYHSLPGLNYAMTNLQAAVGLAQIERHDAMLARRMAILARYREAIPEGRGTWLYVVPKRPMRCVETRPVFQPLHTLPPYRSSEHFPHAERLHRDFMCLPAGPHLSDVDVDRIISEYLGQ